MAATATTRSERDRQGERCRNATAAALEVVTEECGDREGRVEEVTDDIFVFIDDDADKDDILEARLEAALEEVRDRDER